MTSYRLLSLLFRLLGLTSMAETFWHAHELKVKAKEIANTPSTRAELEQTLKDGEL